LFQSSQDDVQNGMKSYKNPIFWCFVFTRPISSFRIRGPKKTFKKDPKPMKEYATEFIRNIALVSHGGGGKTILGEAMLFCTGAITRMGRVEDGNTVSDFEDEEIRRTLSLSTTLLPIEFQEHKLNILDTPGYTDFVGEVISTISVADAAVVLVDSVAGVEVGTEIVVCRHQQDGSRQRQFQDGSLCGERTLPGCNLYPRPASLGREE
jgi:hypothetical protein